MHRQYRCRRARQGTAAPASYRRASPRLAANLECRAAPGQRRAASDLQLVCAEIARRYGPVRRGDFDQFADHARARFLKKDDAVRIARESNEYCGKLMADHPGRFGLFATLPLPHIDETLNEIAFALDALKADGVCMMTSYGGSARPSTTLRR